MNENQGDTSGHDGVMRMKALIAGLRAHTTLTEPDSVNPTPKRGATATWGKDLSIFMEVGPPSKDGSSVCFVATANGRILNRELIFNSNGHGDDYAEAMLAINALMPKIEAEREARRMADIGADCAGILAGAAPKPDDETDTLATILSGLSPEKKALLRSLLEG
jgi:hypothetical protein